MTKQTINIGTALGAGNGDPARVAFDKCNQNFDELYAIVSEDQGIEVPLNLASNTVTDKLRLNGPSSSISGNSFDGVTNYGLLVFTPTQTQLRGSTVGIYTGGTQRFSVDGSGNAAFTGTVSAPFFAGPLNGNAATATTATNVSGGSVNATTAAFSGAVSTNGASVDSSSLTFTAYQTPFNLNFGGGAQNLNIGVRLLSQTINVGSTSEESSVYRFGTGPTKAGSTKAVFLGTGGVGGSTTNIVIGSGAGGTCAIDSPTLNANTVNAASVTASTFIGNLNGNADTATNGVVTTGSYADPSWITSLNYSKLTGTPPTWDQNTTGNAATATRLQTPRNINGVAFDGSANISVNLNNQVTFNNGGSGGASGSTFNGGAPLTVSYNTVGAPSVTGTGASGTWSINISGNAATATSAGTATNQSGGSVNATTGQFSGNVQLNGSTVTTTASTFNLLENSISNLKFGGGTQDLDIGVRVGSQTLNVGSASNTNSIYRFGTGPTQAGDSKSVSLGTGGLAGSTTSVFIGSGAGGTCQIDSPRTNVSVLGLSQAQFPASQVPSGDPNTLDDYEEGTWIPTVAGSTTAGTASYSTRVGSYTKVGRIVTVHCTFDWTGGTGSGRLRITGLPFAASVTGSAYMGSSRIIGGPTWGAGATPTPGINPGFTIVEFDTHTSGAATPGLVSYTPAGAVIFSITYEV